MQFIIKLRYKNTGFFAPATPPGYLSRLPNSDVGVVPLFGDDPVRYRYSSARFVRRELKRSGYNVCIRPYILLVLVKKHALIKARRSKWK